MDSIKQIYKIGYGPSSSHTMGPHLATKIFKKHNPEANRFRVSLYGSLAATGKGHFTDEAILRQLSADKTEIVWHPEVTPEFHTNRMLFEALDEQGCVVDTWSVYSVGGGSLAENPEEGFNRLQNAQQGEVSVYRRTSMDEIQKFIEEQGLSFWEYVEYHEGKDIWDYLGTVWEHMEKSVEEGLNNDSILPGGLHLRSKARQYYIRASSYKPSLQSRALVTSYALAVSEQNARGGVVVTAPTCGSCGVLPGVLYHMKKNHNFTDNDILKALATAGLFGNIIKTNASISGAEVGCQGEVGSACVMAAVAVNQLFGGSPQQIECAGEMAMEHNLGLTCDPVCGLVQIPCIERNPIAALRALDVSFYALLSDGRHIISFDKVIETMKRTGKDIPSLYKETALGGLAALHYTEDDGR